jgi:hypothetical protein
MKSLNRCVVKVLFLKSSSWFLDFVQYLRPGRNFHPLKSTSEAIWKIPGVVETSLKFVCMDEAKFPAIWLVAGMMRQCFNTAC